MEVNEISVRPNQGQTTVRLQSKVRCKKLVRIKALKEHGEIPSQYNALENPFNFTTESLASEEVYHHSQQNP